MVRAWFQSISEYARVSRLVEGRYFDRLLGVFLDDVQGIFVRIEGCHEEERDINTMRFIEVFDLLYDEVEERHSVLEFECALRAGHTCYHFE